MPNPVRNLLADLPGTLPGDALPCNTLAAEQIIELFSVPSVRSERIVSTGQASPPGLWYDQPCGEWLVLLTGAARLLFAGEAAPRSLRAGDFVNIPPHARHRVEWTDPTVPTVWLAIHYRE
jgi:cupin 2 domain-containing protein